MFPWFSMPFFHTWLAGKSTIWFDDFPSYKPPFIGDVPMIFPYFGGLLFHLFWSPW